jgi:hypothetical protein
MEQVLARPLALGAVRRGLPSVGAWTLGFAPLILLGFSGGGYGIVIRSQAGIAVWWIIALGVLVGALRPAMPSRRALVAVLLLAALGVWTWIDIIASESSERTLAEAARIATYLGVFLLGLMAIDRRRAPAVALGVASGVGVIALLAVLSRLQPEIFPANQTGQFLLIAQHRLNWPLNYWNGLAALCALGIPVLLALAAGHARIVVRGVAAAFVPVLALCIDLTISRGGIAAAFVGVVALLALAPNRLRVLAALGVTGAASALLIAAAAQRGLVHADLADGAARSQGNELTIVMAVVAAGAGFMQIGLGLLESVRVSAETRFSSRQVGVATGVGAVLALVVLIAAGGPALVAGAWDQFKSPAAQDSIQSNNDPSRLGSLSSNGRFELWGVALDSMKADPLAGTGPGTYEFTWLRDTTIGGTVLDAHSLYLELGSEAGVPALLLGAAFILSLLSAGWTLRRLDAPTRLLLAGLLASICAFAFSAAVDWVWELSVIPIGVCLLAAAAFTLGRVDDQGTTRPAQTRGRMGVAAAAVVPLGLLAVVLAGASSVQQSRASVRSGNLATALAHAVDAHAVDTGAATPLVQSALVREAGGDYFGAAADARRATLREPQNWRTWLVLSRLDARIGNPDAAVSAFRRARSLNPRHSSLRR